MTTPAVPAPPPPRRHRRVRGALQLVFGLAVTVVVLWAVGGQRGELQGALGYLEDLKWQWVVMAAVMEFLCIVAFGAMQRVLMEAGGVRARLADMTAIVFAGNAIENSLPAGPLWSNVFAFRQFRRRGADDVLAVWVLVATSIASMASLALVAVLGLIFARNKDVAADLAAVAGGIAGLLLIVRYLLRRHTWTLAVVTAFVRLSQRLIRRPRGDAKELVDSGWARLTAVAPGRRVWALAFAFAAANWLWDCLALALCFLAVGEGVPWQGLLLAYGAAQLAVNIPITPGGLGVVEGSLTIALVAYGGQKEATVAAVVLYRLISFWGLLAVGWVAWTVLAYQLRRHTRAEGRPEEEKEKEVVA
ncbi:MAG: flippase-like domain-containing protein [Acidimicrobiia bacterium]|nr:flippase-like domain-containing protein [Acidimicrobiia bacterium]